jgi:hypothetical protein
MQAIVHPPQAATAPSGNGASGHLSEQGAAQTLAPFFVRGQQPPDPAGLGEPQDYPAPWGLVVAALQGGAEATELLPLLSPMIYNPVGQRSRCRPEQPLRDQLAQRCACRTLRRLCSHRPARLPIEAWCGSPRWSRVYGALAHSVHVSDGLAYAWPAPSLAPPLPGKGQADPMRQTRAVLWSTATTASMPQERFGALCRAHGVDVLRSGPSRFPTPILRGRPKTWVTQPRSPAWAHLVVSIT